MQQSFENAFNVFFTTLDAKLTRHHLDKGYKFDRDPLSYTEGKKYIRVIKGGSAFAFIDKTNGNVLKPAGWAAPAKHARGNIFDDTNGLGSIGPYGVAYLR